MWAKTRMWSTSATVLEAFEEFHDFRKVDKTLWAFRVAVAQRLSSRLRVAIVSSSSPRSGLDRFSLTWRPYCPCELGMGGLEGQIGLPC